MGRTMPDAPKDYRYLETHEWHKREADGTIAVGITHFAADELTDITFVSLPKVGDKVTRGQRWGEIESVKATSDLYSGVSGTVSAVSVCSAPATFTERTSRTATTHTYT